MTITTMNFFKQTKQKVPLKSIEVHYLLLENIS